MLYLNIYKGYLSPLIFLRSHPLQWAFLTEPSVVFLSLFPRLRLIGAGRRVVPVVKGDEVFLSDDP